MFTGTYLELYLSADLEYDLLWKHPVQTLTYGFFGMHRFLNTKLRKILNGEDLTLRFLTWDYTNWMLNEGNPYNGKN